VLHQQIQVRRQFRVCHGDGADGCPVGLGNFNPPRKFTRELRSPDAWPAPTRVGKDGKFVP